MPAPNTGGQLRSSIHDMEIGDYIVWRSDGFKYHMDNQPIVTERPITGASSSAMAYQNTFWYGIKVAKGLIISDRVIEHSVSWDTLNSRRQIQGIPITLADNTEGIMRSLGGGNTYVDANGNPSLVDQGLGTWPVDNEYDTYIVNKDYGTGAGRDDVWHFNNIKTWCQDTAMMNMKNPDDYLANDSGKRIARGWANNPQETWWHTSGLTGTNRGFRPVFEYKEV
jgi:hypothetical protein